MNLSENTILITGGTAGIGLALGKALLALDNRVILAGRNTSRFNELAALGFDTLYCDLLDHTSIEKAVIEIRQHYPALNILFNNAGVQQNYAFTETIQPPDKIHDEISVNLTGQIILTQQLIPLLSTADKAFIVNTTSGLGAFPKSDGIVYSAAKAAMRNFTTGLRFSLRKTSIRVREFIPPVTATAMTAGRAEGKMPADVLVKHIIPQLKQNKRILTVPKIRIFLWISMLFPSLAFRILEK